MIQYLVKLEKFMVVKRLSKDRQKAIDWSMQSGEKIFCAKSRLKLRLIRFLTKEKKRAVC